ncbi:protein I'm not dead yet [Spodoptera frugiperda]|uniref:Protein I'm not dead yet n=1 Tax=Spodoptera frugiperda TaxID=7108 RepID=A0A9R0CY42_SPOFR|nr:protein I'm not dead yet [Spodoptera frugiperda]
MASKNPPPPGVVETLQGYLSNPFRKKQEKTPVGGFGERLANATNNNFRGLIGVLVPVAAFAWQIEKENNALKVKIMWLTMTWFFLTQPVSIPVTGLIPVFVLPMSGVMSTVKTCGCYLTEYVMLLIISSMIVVLLNNSGVDRRICLWLLCSGDSCQYSGKRLVFKASVAAYFLSMFCSRLIVTSTLTQLVTNAITKLDSGRKDPDNNPDFITMRNIINNSIQTASSIGSVAFFHTAMVTILFRGAFVEFAPDKKEYPDIFNYLQYSAFAFPLSFVMFLINVSYHMMLINWCLDKGMSVSKMEELQSYFNQSRKEIPRKVSLHERLSVLFLIIVIITFFFRWNQWVDSWGEFRRDLDSPEIPRVKDTTVAAIFVIILHIIPKSYGFVQFLDAEKKSELPPLKAESAILWWRFVDNNVNYGYIFLFGACQAITKAARITGLDKEISEGAGAAITGKSWNFGIFIVVLVATILANLTTSVAACAVWIPFVLCCSVDAPLPWPSKVYVAAMGVGIASSFGFCLPFLYTPAYFCHNTGKVPIGKMIKYNIAAVLICMLCLYFALLIWAPYLFDPDDMGFMPVDAPVPAGATKATTTAAEGGAGGDGGGGDGGGGGGGL